LCPLLRSLAPSPYFDDFPATLLGLSPWLSAPEAGSEQYAPLARAIIGGLLVSVVVTVYLVPAAYLIVHRGKEASPQEAQA